MTQNKLRHFIDLEEVASKDLRKILTEASRVKALFKKGVQYQPLRGKGLAMIFEKNSTRTRISFEMGMEDLGGTAMFLSRNDLQLGRGESIADTARVISRYVDVIMMRCNYHETIEEFKAYATVPIISGLTNKSHPCQIMADIMTFEEHKGPIKGKTLAWIGDVNNVAISMMQGAERFDFSLRIAAPKKFWPKKNVMDWITESKAKVTFTEDIAEAVKGVDCVLTDTWVSMGDAEPEIKRRALRKYQVDSKVMKLAKKDAIFMHCLPAYRGEEVTDDVIDGPQSVVFDEAENRLHVQKGIILWCLGVLK